MMDRYLHVVITIKGSNDSIFLYGDMSEKDLKKKFLSKYHLAKPVLKESKVIDLSQIDSVKIIETTDNMSTALEKLQKESNEKNRQME